MNVGLRGTVWGRAGRYNRRGMAVTTGPGRLPGQPHLSPLCFNLAWIPPSPPPSTRTTLYKPADTFIHPTVLSIPPISPLGRVPINSRAALALHSGRGRADTSSRHSS